MSTPNLVHQSTKQQRALGDKGKTMCGRSLKRFKHTAICALVTCPDCKLHLQQIVALVRQTTP